MGFQLGLNAKLLINTYSDDIGSPRIAVWPATGLAQTTELNDIPEFTNVRNVRTNIDFADTDITTRGQGGWRAFAATLAEAQLEFESIWDPDHVPTTALFAAALARDTVQAVALDKVTDGGQGLWSDWIFSTATRTEDLEEALIIEFTMKVAPNASFPPEWVDINIP